MTNSTVDRDTICRSVVEAICDLNQSLPAAQQVVEGADAKLYGEGAPLDSLGLVNLIVAVEEQLADDLDIEVTLANERAMSRRTSPFQSVATLLDFIEELIREDQSE